MSHNGRGGDGEIYVTPATGGTPIQLTDNTTHDYEPDWGVAIEAPPDTTAPETTINSGPQGPTNNATPSFTFIGSDDTTASADLLYSHKVDGGGWSTYSTDTSATLGGASGLSDGVHTFYVKAKDEAGTEDLSPAERSFTVDTAVPAARPPAQSFVTDSTLGTTEVPVRLLWSATDVGTDVAGYQLQQSVNGGAHANVTLPSETTTALTVSLDPDKTYRYQVRPG
jgi:hypothetical protein